MAGTKERPRLLPPNALRGVCLSLSVSESPDLSRLGLTETHFRLALAEIARCVLVSGGHLAYGGHLDPQGYTNFLIHELDRFSRRDRPLKICLAWPEHRKLSLTQLTREMDELGLNGEIYYLNADGVPSAANKDRAEEPPPALDQPTVQRSLTALRRFMARETQGRILIGGRRFGFHGVMPGLIEEALFAAEAGQPLYIAGGFGGVAHDVAVALGLDDGKWFPMIEPQQSCEDAGGAMGALVRVVAASNGRVLQNGLSREENERLAVSYRPSEIATLVSLGLGRRFPNGDSGQ